MASFTNQGLSTKTLAEIKEDIDNEQQDEISPALDQSTSSPNGQFNSIYARGIAQLEEALALLYANMDPTTATGDALDRISNFTGTLRRAPQKTSVSASLYFSEIATHAPGTLLAYPSGSQGTLFENVAEVDVPSVPYTASNVLMRAVDAGPTQIILGASGLGTLTKISSPVNGWDGLFGSSSLSIGSNEETDTALKLRRINERAKIGSTSVNGIIAELSDNLVGLNTVSVNVNTSSSDVAQGNQPPQSMEVVVWGPSLSNEDIAQVIFDAKAADTKTWGNTFHLIADTFGNQHEVWFTRPVTQPISIDVTLTYQNGQSYPGDDFVKATIISNASSSFVPGLNVAPSKINSWVQNLDGVLWITDTQINGASAVYEISANQIAAITSSADITINSSVGNP